MNKKPSNDDRDSALRLTINSPHTDNIPANAVGQSKWYRVQMEGTVDVTLSFVSLGGGDKGDEEADLDFDIFDEQGRVLEKVSDFHPSTERILDLNLPGKQDYLIQVLNPYHSGSTEFNIWVTSKK